jgi:hypothetical protein
MAPPLRVKHSSRLVARYPNGVRQLGRVVRHARDAELLRFVAMAVIEWLPVERRRFRSGLGAGRGQDCKLCGAGSESVRHVYECDLLAMKVVARGLVRDAAAVLTAHGVRVHWGPSPPVVLDSGDHKTTRRKTVWLPAWFDTQQRLWLELLVPGKWRWDPKAEDGFAAMLGVLPHEVNTALDWHRLDSGEWCRREISDTAGLMDALRLSLARGACRVYKVRCALMDEWWKSGAAAKYRDMLAHQIAVSRREKREARAAKVYNKWLADRSSQAPVAVRRSTRIRVMTQKPFFVRDVEVDIEAFAEAQRMESGARQLSWW